MNQEKKYEKSEEGFRIEYPTKGEPSLPKKTQKKSILNRAKGAFKEIGKAFRNTITSTEAKDALRNIHTGGGNKRRKHRTRKQKKSKKKSRYHRKSRRGKRRKTSKKTKHNRRRKNKSVRRR